MFVFNYANSLGQRKFVNDIFIYVKTFIYIYIPARYPLLFVCVCVCVCVCCAFYLISRFSFDSASP